ncbi:uncharacterized protein DUF4153 [Novosphingobium sp. PhB57]|nr:uncharacterized protein DUF4153 [Novosphingobium sp. PhB57]
MNIFAGPDETQNPTWPLRAWGLALLGGLSGLLIYWIIRPDKYLPNLDHADLRAAAASFIAIAAVLLGFVVERGKLGWNIAFAIVGGALVGLTVYFNGPFGEGEDAWRVACAALAVAICTPLFQAWRGAQPSEGPLSRAIPYPEAYRHAWGDVVLWLAAWAFVGVVWAMATLLGQLFKLIGIVILAELLNDAWMMLTLSGAALGAGIAMLRDRDHILALMQRVVTTILSVLAPLLAIGLLVFLAAIPFTGLAPLWGATRSTSPILLSCIVGALCLANAVIGEEQPHEARSPLLRASVGALGVCMLPLALIAALSIGLRLHQYGLTPDRLWAVIFSGIACAYGLAYIVTLAHRRLGAAPYLRAANLHLRWALRCWRWCWPPRCSTSARCPRAIRWQCWKAAAFRLSSSTGPHCASISAGPVKTPWPGWRSKAARRRSALRPLMRSRKTAVMRWNHASWQKASRNHIIAIISSFFPAARNYLPLSTTSSAVIRPATPAPPAWSGTHRAVERR